ncbi:MAG: hypothetical protein DMG04_01050 [Acidobacteria bacterium]|nr:MAG: hypothetical protein DMG04_01050 [Acidobacteriota bacterium]
MDRLEHALQLERSCHFILALRELEHVSLSGDGKTDAQVLKAGLLERLGRHAQSRAIAMSVLSSRNASARSRARCECILGRLDREKGAIHQAIERFQKAAMLAGETVDLQCLSASGADDITVPLHGKLTPTIERIEREMIKAALQEHQGKVDEAAKALGISRKGLYLKRHRFGL